MVRSGDVSVCFASFDFGLEGLKESSTPQSLPRVSRGSSRLRVEQSTLHINKKITRFNER